MYYDTLLALVGVACLFAEPGRLFRTRVFDLTAPPVLPLQIVAPPGAHAPGSPGGDAPGSPSVPFGPRLVGYVNSFPLTVLLGMFLLDNLFHQWAVEATV